MSGDCFGSRILNDEAASQESKYYASQLYLLESAVCVESLAVSPLSRTAHM